MSTLAAPFSRPVFAYNQNCQFCRCERAHTQAQHDRALAAAPACTRHDYRDGDLCSRCDNPKPLRGGGM